jgi:heme/copper-type cytochrome/quinol oxidase subunit 4
MTSPHSRYQGWPAIGSAAATVLMVIAAILGSSVNLGETFSVLVIALMGLMVLVALGLHLVSRGQAPALSLAATIFSVLGAILTVAAHILRMAGVLSDAQFNTFGEGLGPAAIGLWLLLANYLALRGKALPRALAWIGLVAGAGYLLSGVGALLGGPRTLDEGPQNALSSIGPLGIFLVYPIWAVWLGRRALKLSGTTSEPLGELP